MLRIVSFKDAAAFGKQFKKEQAAFEGKLMEVKQLQYTKTTGSLLAAKVEEIGGDTFAVKIFQEKAGAYPTPGFVYRIPLSTAKSIGMSAASGGYMPQPEVTFSGVTPASVFVAVGAVVNGATAKGVLDGLLAEGFYGLTGSVSGTSTLTVGGKNIVVPGAVFDGNMASAAAMVVVEMAADGTFTVVAVVHEGNYVFRARPELKLMREDGSPIGGGGGGGGGGDGGGSGGGGGGGADAGAGAGAGSAFAASSSSSSSDSARGSAPSYAQLAARTDSNAAVEAAALVAQRSKEEANAHIASAVAKAHAEGRAAALAETAAEEAAAEEAAEMPALDGAAAAPGAAGAAAMPPLALPHPAPQAAQMAADGAPVHNADAAPTTGQRRPRAVAGEAAAAEAAAAAEDAGKASKKLKLAEPSAAGAAAKSK
jgi:hypothetical protein